mgnify:FL=1|jgi:hypothetical protein
MNIQDKMQEIHHKYGVTEKANYEIQLFIEDLIIKDRAEQLTLTDVSQQRELLIDFSKKIMFGEDWTPPLPYEQMVDDYLKGN